MGGLLLPADKQVSQESSLLQKRKLIVPANDNQSNINKILSMRRVLKEQKDVPFSDYPQLLGCNDFLFFKLHFTLHIQNRFGS
jgi:hypothetical protein